MTIQSTLLAGAVLAALSLSAAQAAQPLQAARAGDQVPAALVAAPLPADDSERAPLSFAWALDPAQSLQAATPYASVSRSYWQQVDGTQLQRGLDLPLTAADAVIQLSPAEGARAVPANSLQVRDPAGRSSVARSVDARALQEAGMPVSDGSSMLRTGATSAAGAYTLQSAQAQGRYVVQVLEPNSPLRLEVQANQGQVLAGGNLQLQARLLEDGATPQRWPHAAAAWAVKRCWLRRTAAAGRSACCAPPMVPCVRRCGFRLMSATRRGCGSCRCSPRPMVCCAMARSPSRWRVRPRASVARRRRTRPVDRSHCHCR